MFGFNIRGCLIVSNPAMVIIRPEAGPILTHVSSVAPLRLASLGSIQLQYFLALRGKNPSPWPAGPWPLRSGGAFLIELFTLHVGDCRLEYSVQLSSPTTFFFFEYRCLRFPLFEPFGPDLLATLLLVNILFKRRRSA